MTGARPEVNRLRLGWTWEVIADTLLTQIRTARRESNRIRGVRNLGHVFLRGRYLTELEELISPSDLMRNWVDAPEPTPLSRNAPYLLRRILAETFIQFAYTMRYL
jgi:hypothetical protein